MIRLIAETAWHHEGDYPFMKNLVETICKEPSVGVVKLHITLDLDEYMSVDHAAYETLKGWMFSAGQWAELIGMVRDAGKGLMLLLNDTQAVEFAARFKPEMVELHSVCLNVPRLQRAVLEQIDEDASIVVGVGGCSLQEVDAAVRFFEGRDVVLMFGFQNYPTKYEDVNLAKIRKIQSLYPELRFGYADHTGFDETHNELITLLVAANGMDFIEKHVTTVFGQKRCDFSAAVSPEMFAGMAAKVKVLEQLMGDGSLGLNTGEQAYSQYGPMKMAALASRNIAVGDVLTEDSFTFCRTGQKSDTGQIEMCALLGQIATEDVAAGQVLTQRCFRSEG